MNISLRENRGFTLIEVVIVICILGLLMGAFGTGLSRWLPDYRLKRSVMEFRSALQRVRLEAVKNNTNADFDYTTISLPSGVELNGVVNFPTPVTFNSRGFPINLANEGEIRLKNSKDTYKGVSINIVGNSRVIKSLDNGATWF
jgi:prepilin-type N-terminal cleavage/methylation domain-containing protein